ncbi:phosphonate C-P lyase system protein PhnH [Nonomuraea sp. NPDC050404]|uniref:phosphonate C-P lyase system protein PhnH n=1 Tax=Nonomuraea sp. NPDC050404 TaxID=3155783 RepID=UPI0033C2B0AB
MTITAATPPFTAPGGWPALRALPGATSQRIFRACLTALSRPGTITRLPAGCLPEQVPAVVAPMLALTDLMTPLTGLESADAPGAREAADLVGRVTGAKYAEPGRARFALAFGESEELADLSPGSHWSPERGALLCRRVAGLSDAGAHPLRLRLTGPGVKDSAELTVAGPTPRFFELRAGLTADFPAGVDILLVTDDGDVAGLPRTTRIEVG